MQSESREFLDALRPDAIVEGAPSGAGSVVALMRSRDWFDRRRRELVSTGGRPTNPLWTLRRQVPFAENTWERLRELADAWGSEGASLAPAQVAAMIIEEATRHYDAPAEEPVDPLTGERLPERFREWERPQLFFGVAAA